MKKKTILHIIYDLGRGGAETMLVTVTRELKEYNNVIVTLCDGNHFTEAELRCDKYISLGNRSVFQMPRTLLKLRRVLKQENPDLVHTHLFWPTVLARMAVPRRIPLITTIHAFVSGLVDYKKWYLRLMDRFTFRLRKSTVITVAAGAMDEYVTFQRKKPARSHVLYTFVNTAIFSGSRPSAKPPARPFRLIAVGALRIQKNYQYLIDAFRLLPHDDFQLHIYGTGNLAAELEESVRSAGVNVVLKGEVNNIHEIIQQYDLFVMASTYEGFSLAVLEAMAMEMPLLLSDIPSFREQCLDTAAYFSIANPADFAARLQAMAGTREQLRQMAAAAKQRALAHFTLHHHMQGLREIYTAELG